MLHSDLLSASPDLLHAFTDREGGCGTSPYGTLNLAYHVGDDASTVDRNHAALAEKLGYDQRRLIHMRQVHSDRVVQGKSHMGFDTRPECDALITDIPGQPLMVMTADCTPVLLYDPEHHAIATVHAGRAGALKNIVTRTVKAMQRTYNSRPEALLAALGPAIHACCYAINTAIAATVSELGYTDALVMRGGSPYLDVNTILFRQLSETGLEHIDNLGICTACRNELLFSYRADRQHTGRQAGIIMLE